MRARAVVFDAVGTLIYPCPAVGEAYQRAALAQGIDVPVAEVARRFREAFAAEEARDRSLGGDRTSQERELARWRTIVGSVFPEAGDPTGLFESLWSHFARPANWRLFDDVAPAWSALAGRGLRLAIASNFDERLEAIAAGLPPLDGAEGLFVSSRLGRRKPAREFFSQIAASLDLPPGEIVMLGDSPAGDVDAALAAGWQAVLVDRDGGSTGGISRLTELIARVADA